MSDFLKPIEVLQNYVSNIFGGSGSLKNLVIGSQGFIRSGQTGYNTGIGFWLGDATGTAKFSIGNSSGNKLTWNGTDLVFSGSLSAASGTFSGAITGGTLKINNAWHVDSNGNMWWGDFTTYASATIKISSAGAVNFTSGIISGEMKIGTSTDYFRALSNADGSYLRLYLNSILCVDLHASASEPHGIGFYHPDTGATVGAICCGTDMQFWVAAGNNYYFDNGIIVQQAWQTPTLVNSWVNYGAPYNTAQYMKDSMGFVHLKGLIKDGTIGARAFTLPAGYRPVARELYSVYSSTNPAKCESLSTGEVIPSGGGNGYFSLDGIIFRAV